MDFEAGDMTVRIECDINVEQFEEFLKRSSDMQNACFHIDVGYAILEEVKKPQLHGRYMRVLISDNDGFGLDAFTVLDYLNFFIGQISENHKSCHGVGIKAYDKGIILIGNSGNGKSTLADILGGEIINDDFLLVTPTHMDRITRYGIKVDPKTYKISPVESEHPCAIDYVFLLDKTQEPQSAMRIDPRSIPIECLFDDKLHPSLLDHYKKRMPIDFLAQVYRIGTNGNPEQSKRMIEEIVSR